jgi:hypothetical protein
MRSTILRWAIATLSVASLLTLGTTAASAQGGQGTAVAQDRFGGVMVRVQVVVGTKFWAWTDDWGENANWGLVSFLDNAYDGKEAIRAPGKDQWGFPVGVEERDYGDFLTAARQVNAGLARRLADDVARQIASGTPTPQPERR